MHLAESNLVSLYGSGQGTRGEGYLIRSLTVLVSCVRHWPGSMLDLVIKTRIKCRLSSSTSPAAHVRSLVLSVILSPGSGLTHTPARNSLVCNSYEPMTLLITTVHAGARVLRAPYLLMWSGLSCHTLFHFLCQKDAEHNYAARYVPTRCVHLLFSLAPCLLLVRVGYLFVKSTSQARGAGVPGL